MKVKFIRANWHSDMTERGFQGFKEKISTTIQVDEQLVPGALELPLAAQKAAREGGYDAIICCAFVVNGGVYQHEFVAQAVLDGIMRVNLDEGIPVLNLTLSPHQYHDIPEHRQFFRKHMVKKGAETADATHMLLGIKPKETAAPKKVTDPSSAPAKVSKKTTKKVKKAKS